MVYLILLLTLLLKKKILLFDYGLFKGIMEITIGILFIFKYDLLTDLFPCILGLIIVFINIFKLQHHLALKNLVLVIWQV